MLLSCGYFVCRLLKMTRLWGYVDTGRCCRCLNKMSQEIVKSSCILRLTIELIKKWFFFLVYNVVVKLIISSIIKTHKK